MRFLKQWLVNVERNVNQQTIFFYRCGFLALGHHFMMLSPLEGWESYICIDSKLLFELQQRIRRLTSVSLLRNGTCLLSKVNLTIDGNTGSTSRKFPDQHKMEVLRLGYYLKAADSSRASSCWFQGLECRAAVGDGHVKDQTSAEASLTFLINQMHSWPFPTCSHRNTWIKQIRWAEPGTCGQQGSIERQHLVAFSI